MIVYSDKGKLQIEHPFKDGKVSRIGKIYNENGILIKKHLSR